MATAKTTETEAAPLPDFEVMDVGWLDNDETSRQLGKHWKEAWDAAGYDTSDEEWNYQLKAFYQGNQKAGLQPRTFVASANGVVIGSVHCQVWAGPLPWVVQPEVFRLGSVWGLHVDSSAPVNPTAVRRELLKAALAHLRSLRCSKVVTLALTKEERDALVAADVGFQSANMLTRDLTDTAELDTEGAPTAPSAYKCAPSDGSCDAVVCGNWRRMWADVGIPAEALMPNMEEVTLSFLKQARERLNYQTFLARDENNEIVGSVSCQVWEGPMPTSTAQLQLGTIWAVYVDPAHRRRGVATTLMKLALRYLQNVGCDAAILIAASEGGQRVYERLGFRPNNALVCDFSGEEISEPHSSAGMVEEEKKHEGDVSDGQAAKAESKRALNKALQQALVGVFSEEEMTSQRLTAMATATTRQISAVYGDPSSDPRAFAIAEAVKKAQIKHGRFVHPDDNWFTRNVTKFGRGFDMKQLKEDPTKLAHKFDRLSHTYDHWTIGNQSKVESFIVDCARSRINDLKDQTTRILDVACGIGLQGQVLRLCGFEGVLVGTDISQGMVQRVMERGCYNHGFVANANESLKRNDKENETAPYDIILCTGAMELLDQPKVLADLAKMTKPEGEIWVSFQQYSRHNPTSHQNVHGMSEEEAVELLKSSGFADVVSVEECPDAFYTPSPRQDGSLLPVPYLFIVAKKQKSNN